MKTVLHLIMFGSLGIMIWLAKEYHTKGRANANPISVVLAMISIAAAVLCIGWDFWFLPDLALAYRQKEAKYQYVAYKYLGQKIATTNL